MSWDVVKVTRPIARKDYHCDASDYIENEIDWFSQEDWEIIQSARNDEFLIKKGMRYLHIRGLWDGGFQTVRMREDLEGICQKYDLFPEE